MKVEPITAEQVSALDAFLKREFKGRWRYDVNNKIKVEGRSDFVYGLWVNGSLEGFSLTQGCDLQIAYLRRCISCRPRSDLVRFGADRRVTRCSRHGPWGRASGLFRFGFKEKGTRHLHDRLDHLGRLVRQAWI